MKIVVSGGSGFLGTPLVARLLKRGDEVVVLTRDPSRVSAGRGVEWHPPAQGAWSGEVAAADVVINLAGENVGDGRWSESRKKRLVSSRLDATRALVEAMRANPSKPRTFISASAVGYYGLLGDEPVDESAPRGNGFLAELTEKWEAAAREADSFTRLVIPRFGVVLDAGGGALAKMLIPFRLFAGGPVGNGKQWMSWVDREDALRATEWAIGTESARGIYNVTAPHPVLNRDFAKAIGRAIHRPALLPAPALPLRLLFGDMADEVLLGGQRVVPARITSEGFAFRYPTIEESLAHMFPR
jgi:uncharacterized protein (TIGR01777 family)